MTKNNSRHTLVEKITDCITKVIYEAFDIPIHFWANTIINAEDIALFEAETSDIGKCVIGLRMILKNHKMVSDMYFSEDNAKLYLNNLDLNNVPAVADLQMLSDELKGVLDIDIDFGCISYSLTEEEPFNTLDELISVLERYNVIIKE